MDVSYTVTGWALSLLHLCTPKFRGGRIVPLVCPYKDPLGFLRGGS